MPSLDALAALGYDVQIASGSVIAEQDALTAAQVLAAPERIEADVQAIADKAALDATALAVARGIAAAKIPAAVSEAVARITTLALDHITVARSEAVSFHERALEIAKGMPTTYVVSGPGVTTVYLDIDDATGEPTAESAPMVASLLDPDAHRERLFQHNLGSHPKPEIAAEIFACVTELRAHGWAVAAEIAEGATNPTAVIAAEGQPETVTDTVAKLRGAAATLPDLTA